MKKITDSDIGNYLNLTRQSIYNLKNKKPKQYQIIKNYLILEKNNFFKDFKKIKALFDLIKEDCNNKYISDLEKLILKQNAVVEELTKIEKENK